MDRDDDDRDPERVPLHPSARSSARMGLNEAERVGPGLVHCRIAGYMRLTHLESAIFAANEEIRRGYRVRMFIDADDVHGYEGEARRVFQTWAKRNRDSIEGIWVLYRSPIVKMGVSLANAFTAGLIRGFASPEEFERAFATATRRSAAGEFRESR